jgi:hypothetical protein
MSIVERQSSSGKGAFKGCLKVGSLDNKIHSCLNFKVESQSPAAKVALNYFNEKNKIAVDLCPMSVENQGESGPCVTATIWVNN